MFTVAVISTKGGVGKTTTAAYLGLALDAVNVGLRLVDADPTSEGSLASWAKIAGENFPEVVHANKGQIPSAALDGDGIAVIDTAPGITEGIAGILPVANFLILPTRPGRADLERTGSLIQTLSVAGLRGLVLLTHTRATNITRQALRLLGNQSQGFILYPDSVPLSVRFESAFGTIPRDLSPYDKLAADLKGLAA